MRNIKLILALVFPLWVLYGCNFPQAIPAKEVPAGASQVWIDAPRDGSRLPLAPYEIVYHVNAPLGVGQVELSVNGDMLAVTTDTSGELMQTLRTLWTPGGPGEFTIRLRMQDSAGNWSETGEVTVFIGREPTSTQATTTPTPTMTITPTATTNAAALTFTAQADPLSAYYGSCSPHQVSLQVTVANAPDNISVVVFARVQDQSSGNWTSWDGGTAMNPAGSNTFKTTLDITGLDNANAYAESRLNYQFVVVEKGEVIARSPVYQDVSLYACGINFPYMVKTVPFNFPLTTNTPIIVK